MDSCQALDYQNKFKLKASMLGGLEILKNIFQKQISSSNLPINHKKTIGVNISSVNFDYNIHNTKFELYIWNVDCGLNYASVRSTFYRGSEAIIVFISERKLGQILEYLEEIQFQMPVIQIILCVLIDKYTVESIKQSYFSNRELKEYNFEFNSIKSPDEVLSQICTRFLEKRETKKKSDYFVVNFLNLNELINNLHYRPDSEEERSALLTCNNYVPAEINSNKLNPNYRANLKILNKYVRKLGDFEIVEDEWLFIPNKRWGNFFVWLKTGDVYIIPKICLNCSLRKCKFKKNKKRHVCIAASSKGYSNNEELHQKELLILAKIYAIIYSQLPKDVVEKLDKFNKCKLK